MNNRKILSFDGGGVRALAGLVFLAELEKHSNSKIFNIFDYFAGVSAGSLNAFGFAAKQMTSEDVQYLWSEYYLKRIKEPNSFWDRYSIIQSRPKYDNLSKIEVLEEIFGDMHISESIKPVLSLTYNLEQRSPEIHTSYGDTNIKIIDACCASTAAPIYFPTFKASNDNWYIDGGVASNNPTLIAFSEAQGYFSDEDLKILSIGTGLNKRKISGPKSSKWGGLGWLRHDIMGIMLETELEHKISKNLLKDRYLRINSPLGSINRRLDDVSELNIKKIQDLGITWWKNFGEEVLKFLEL